MIPRVCPRLTAETVLSELARRWIDVHFFRLRLRAVGSNHGRRVSRGVGILVRIVSAAATAVCAAGVYRRLRVWVVRQTLVTVLVDGLSATTSRGL